VRPHPVPEAPRPDKQRAHRPPFVSTAHVVTSRGTRARQFPAEVFQLTVHVAAASGDGAGLLVAPGAGHQKVGIVASSAPACEGGRPCSAAYVVTSGGTRAQRFPARFSPASSSSHRKHPQAPNGGREGPPAAPGAERVAGVSRRTSLLTGLRCYLGWDTRLPDPRPEFPGTRQAAPLRRRCRRQFWGVRSRAGLRGYLG
jgi:hypothetical protein